MTNLANIGFVLLVINNSYSFVDVNNLSTDYAIIVISSLYNLLSYRRPGVEFIKTYRKRQVPEWLKWVRLYNKKYNSFPTGLLYKVEQYLKETNIPYKIQDNRIAPESHLYYDKLHKLPPLRFYQEDILNLTKIHPRGVVESATGTGKTLIIKELIHQKALRTLITVPSSNILDIFYEQLFDLYGAKHIGLITSGHKDLDKNITIATYQSLPKIPMEWFETHPQMVVSDEFHHSASDTLYQLNLKQFKNIYFRYGFTATNYRNNETDMSLKGVLSDVIYSYDFTKAIRDGYLCPVNFVIYENSHMESYDDWREENQELLVKNDRYNEAIANIAKKLDAKNIPTLIFVNEIEHGKTLKAKIPNSVFLSGEEHRKLNKQKLADFNDLKYNILIGTSVIGEGVDTVPAKVGILASGYKAESEVVQKIGRLLRPHPNKKSATFIDFTNQGSRYLNRHYKARKHIYEKYEGEIIYKSLFTF